MRQRGERGEEEEHCAHVVVRRWRQPIDAAGHGLVRRRVDGDARGGGAGAAWHRSHAEGRTGVGLQQQVRPGRAHPAHHRPQRHVRGLGAGSHKARAHPALSGSQAQRNASAGATHWSLSLGCSLPRRAVCHSVRIRPSPPPARIDPRQRERGRPGARCVGFGLLLCEVSPLRRLRRVGFVGEPGVEQRPARGTAEGAWEGCPRGERRCVRRAPCRDKVREARWVRAGGHAPGWEGGGCRRSEGYTWRRSQPVSATCSACMAQRARA